MYVELHAHSAFSFLDGASLPDELAGAAAELGYSAMALTDHNGVSGSMEFAQAAAPLGLRSIQGAEVELDDGRHVTLLVETEQGWRHLCHLLTHAHAHTRGSVDESAEARAARQAGRGRHQSLVGTRMRRVDVPPQIPLTALAEYAAGLVCLSGCATQRRPRRAEPARAAAPPSGPTICGSSCSGRSCATTAPATARWPISRRA